MRALIQRVSEASVSIDGQVVGAIGPGFLVLLGVSRYDTDEDASYIVSKVVNLRIFSDDEGKFQSSAIDIGAELLVVSQFTLYGETRKGRRPSFTLAAAPDEATRLFDLTVALFEETGLKVETGTFQAHMAVALVNDGPVTLMLDTADRERPRRG
ncbi:MAG: D-aminoacyl-tRNA deacylase [SAR202 cluster bacterium]|jgi:D-tyrosyl-tRNA(Tyr) deacylase|nr:D-aminoacyl-tRNA deacylase [SAR202 cluster bacterium]